MYWYLYIIYFFAGAFLANSIPHFISGIQGKRFQSPFASPPGKGLSSATVNVLWGFVNFVIGYLLITSFGNFIYGLSLDSLMVGLGVLFLSLMSAKGFGKLNSK